MPGQNVTVLTAPFGRRCHCSRTPWLRTHSTTTATHSSSDTAERTVNSRRSIQVWYRPGAAAGAAGEGRAARREAAGEGGGRGADHASFAAAGRPALGAAAGGGAEVVAAGRAQAAADTIIGLPDQMRSSQEHRDGGDREA